MRKIYTIGFLLLLSIASLNSCKPADEDGVLIQGRVMISLTQTPISNALVQITSPEQFNNIFGRTDSTGGFSLGNIEIDDVTDISITASAPNYIDAVKNIKITPNDNITGLDFFLIPDDSSNAGGGPSGPSGEAASIHLLSLSEESINISATGGITSSVFTFQVQDSSGNNLDLLNATEVDFSIISGPNGGESISPTSITTDASGVAKAVLSSGNRSGVVQIEAKIVRTVSKFLVSSNDLAFKDSNPSSPKTFLNDDNINKSSTTLEKQENTQEIVITSKPVAITIHGGFPDQDHFTLSSENTNYEYTQDAQAQITALLGDSFSNPVRPGTAVYFSTSPGIIEGSSEGHTDENGNTSVQLVPARAGLHTITATTINADETEIEQSLELIFSTSKATITAPDELVLSSGESSSISYTVTDLNGEPMAPGTTVELSANQELLTLSGANSITIEEDENNTSFSVTVQTDETFSGATNIEFLVTSPSGTTTSDYITVTSTGGGVTGTPEAPASLELLSVSEETINIAESGGITNTAFTFQVQDSAGRNLNSESPVEVAFSILSGPDGGENITPSAATTDAQGRVTSNLNAGNTAGVVQIQAQVVGTSIISKPVAVTIHGGFPVQNNFSVRAEYRNYEFINDLEIPVTASVGDAHNNPVKPGTAVYFTTDNGLIDGSSEQHTDANGNAEVFYRPDDYGNAQVTAQTVDENDSDISTSAAFLFTSSKAIISSDFDDTEIVLASGENQSVDFIVTDQNTNPMATGTNIEVTTSSINLTLSGDIAINVEDAIAGGPGITEFNFNISAGENFTGSANALVTVTSSSGVVTSHAIVIKATGGGVTGTPEAPASLELLSVSQESINIAESGGITNTAFTFQVQDSAGRNLNSDSQVEVVFSILSGPDGGEYITPSTTTSDAQGRVTSNLNAGNTSGVVQIQAQVVGTSIISKPVAVTIHGGFPDQDHFTLEPLTDTNIEGFDRNGVEITYKVRLGDEFSNPVKPGTAVYFETTGGIIEGSGEGHTDETGYTEVTLFAGNPRPADGKGTVTATTTNKNNVEISQTKEFIFSTSKALITPSVTTLELTEFETQRVEYTVSDLNGNPMAAGTRIQVSAEDKLQLSGDLDVTLANDLNPGTNITDFSFSVTAPSEYKGSELITIQVTSPAGIVTTNKELAIGGIGGGVAGEPSGAANIILENLTENTINIIETGGTVNSTFTFQVQDSSGRALNLDNPVEVEFEIIQGPGGGESIIPTRVFTNSTGRVTSSIVSGNTAGVVRIQAKVERPDIGLTILSKPVAITIHGGFPDLNHFSIAPDKYNFEGYNINGQRNEITVIVGDKFSNPVKPGTAVYFSTTGGVIEGSSAQHTGPLGEATVTLLSGQPRPIDGKFVVTARTIDENNAFIEQTVDMIFSTSQAQISANPTTFDLPPNGGATFTYTVEDLNGNPMPAGTNIEIIAGQGMEISGDGNVTLGDYLNPGPGATEFTFSIRDTDSDVNDPADLSIQIVVTTPSGRVTSLTPISGIRRKVPGN